MAAIAGLVVLHHHNWNGVAREKLSGRMVALMACMDDGLFL